MSNQIDQISNMLGSIEQSIKYLVEKTSSIDGKVEKLQEDNYMAKSSLTGAHKRLDRLEPTVREHESLKNKGLGVVAFVGFVFGGLGAFLTKIIHIWQ